MPWKVKKRNRTDSSHVGALYFLNSVIQFVLGAMGDFLYLSSWTA